MAKPERTPVSTLARGLVREELRALKRASGETNAANSAQVRLFQMAVDRCTAPFTKGKRLSETDVARLRQDLIAFIRENYKPIVGGTYKQRIAGFEGSVSRVDAHYYMQSSPHRLSKVGDEEAWFDEESVELRYSRVVVDRKRVVLDDLSCNLSFSAHALARLIERGACEREPIKFLGRRISQMLPLVPLFAFSTIASRENLGVLIPVGDGALLGSYTLTRDPLTIAHHYRRRLKIDRLGSGPERMPVINPFADHDYEDESMVSLRINTFLDHDALKPAQEWVRDGLTALLQKHQDKLATLVGMVTTPEMMLVEGFASQTLPAFVDFSKLIGDPRWDRALNL